MNWLQLIVGLLPLIEQVIKAVTDATKAGKTPEAIHTTITDHVAALPAKINQ